MDKLKYIKLKNEDGSYTNSIPLAVDSDHVDINGDTLTTKLGTLATRTEVQAIASGSPAGVYETLAALTAADPDHSKIYVVTANGHWYYYNSNQWNDGGVYQAAEDSRTINNLENNDAAITNKMIYVQSINVWNPNEEHQGFVAPTGAIDSTSKDYIYVGKPIKVKPGDVLKFYNVGNNDNFTSAIYRFICAYDINMNVVPASGSSSGAYSFTVPNDIYYVIPSLYANNKKRMVTINENETAVGFSAYFDPYYQAGEGFLDNISINDTDFEDVYMDKSNVNRLDPDNCQLNKFLAANGAITDNNNYFVTNYIPVVENENLYLFQKSTLNKIGIRAYCVYNSSYGVIGGSNTEGQVIPYIEGAAYVRASCIYSSSNPNTYPNAKMIVSTETPEKAVDYGNKPVIKEEYLPDSLNRPELHVYLPKEIPVGIGRTIELYNELICLEADKYHLHWQCSTGIAYKRKFSITGATAGNYTLTLQIFNDNMEMIWSGTSTVKVIANNISTPLKVLPIGDSLTNIKPWLNEVKTLSNDKIVYIGTRGRQDQTLRHEGRSGYTAKAYNENSSYTFDNNYVGNPNVSSSTNPFWDATNNRFSLAYYNEQQSSYVGTADAVQLFLGTNDVFGASTPEGAANYIKDLVDAIREDDADIPIFVCNTIYRSNQSGYYSSGGQGFTAAGGWAFDSDMKIMKLQNALDEALKNYTNVYIIPCSVCMDRENDFGQVEVAVNPRLSTTTEFIPNESVHPQTAGYMQIADVIYSSYIAHLN